MSWFGKTPGPRVPATGIVVEGQRPVLVSCTGDACYSVTPADTIKWRRVTGQGPKKKSRPQTPCLTPLSLRTTEGEQGGILPLKVDWRSRAQKVDLEVAPAWSDPRTAGPWRYPSVISWDSQNKHVTILWSHNGWVESTGWATIMLPCDTRPTP